MSVSLIITLIILIKVIIFLVVGIYQKSTNAICLSKKRLDGRTVLVTGGTAGMGLEAATDFAQRGARVIVACPFEDEGKQAVQTIVQNSENDTVVFKLLDLASFTSVRKFAVDILENEERLDVLVNNAGVLGPGDAVSQDRLNFIMQVNYYGAFLLTLLLLPLLKKTGHPGEPSRIVNLLSIMRIFGTVDMENQHITSWKAYGNSKLCMEMFSRALTKRLQNPFNLVINNVDPGVAPTKIFFTAHRFFGYVPVLFYIPMISLFSILFKSPWEAAQTTIHVALDRKAGEVSGMLFKNCKQIRGTSAAFNEQLANKVFDESVTKVKLSNEELKQCLSL